MRSTFVLAALLLVVLCACGGEQTGVQSGPTAAIVGTWVLDRSTPGGGDLPAVEYTFAANGTFTLVTTVAGKPTESTSGLYGFADGRYVVIEKTRDGKAVADDDPKRRVEMTLADGGLTFQSPDAPVVR